MHARSAPHTKRLGLGISTAVAMLVVVAVVLTPDIGAAVGSRSVAEQTSGDGTAYTIGVRREATGIRRGNGCTATGEIWVQEHRKSGVTRFKTRWELRGYYDTGIMPTYGSVGWWSSTPFPDDYASYWMYFGLPYGYLNFSSGKQFSLWAKSGGQRPSWWRPDLTRRVRVGELGCEWGVPMG